MDAIPFLVSPPCLIPSVRFNALKAPSSLPRHLMSILPSNKTAQPENVTKVGQESDTIKASGPSPTKQTGNGDIQASGFLAMPNVTMPAMTMPNVNLNMDVRKWTWPGYLTFGKTSGKVAKPSKSLGDEKATPDPSPAVEPPEGIDRQVNVSVDAQSLEEAMSSDGVVSSQDDRIQAIASPETDSSVPSSTAAAEEIAAAPDVVVKDAGDDHPKRASESTEINASPEETTPSAEQAVAEENPIGEPAPVEENVQAEEIPTEQGEDASVPAWTQSEDIPPLPIEPLPKLSRTQIYLSDPEEPLLTRKRRMFYLTVCNKGLESNKILIVNCRRII